MATISDFTSKFINLLTTDTEEIKDEVEFCRSLFINRKYHRLILYIDDRKNENKFDTLVNYWYMLSLLKLKRYKDCEIYLNSISEGEEETEPKYLYVRGLLLLKQMDFGYCGKYLQDSFVADPTFYDPINKLLSHHLLSESLLSSLIYKDKNNSKISEQIHSIAVNSWLFEGDANSAFESASKLLKENPSSDKAITAFVSACMALGKSHDLFVVAQRLLETTPDSYLASFAAGCHVAMSGRSDAARSLLWFTLKRMPSFAPAWLAYAMTYKNDNDNRMALSVIMTAARAFPKLNLLHLWAAYFCVQSNDFALALAHLQMCRPSGYVYNEVGCILMKNGRISDALKAFQKAIVAKDVCNAYIINAATCYRRNNNFIEAERLYREAIQKEPDNLTCLIGLAFTLQLMDKREEAYKMYFRAITIDPDNAFANEMLSNLGSDLASDQLANEDEDPRFYEKFAEFMKENAD
ncbi:TPR Domain containing protein [Trichomonas vaginalis G3]|uniref:TPR Domain containing protein n=1 Tax=Trichomonas vaginalis (strain ATCC PRA-98 / G3) TaxID=412133 RepID=A2DMN4_TRIV3|nr:cell division [Trichomonas vaginalis G3]EAY18255.1 TPR Domain containing protein [Trichomonas vaginalis G3]KAI5541924.1 cell division [Trichomonas vaginalis G3]|eukprot:XP_001579241.1 TPR Domain containing protein [Trichomonas vaginalis G3]